MVSVKPSFLFGYSRAMDYGYIPTDFMKLDRLLVKLKKQKSKAQILEIRDEDKHLIQEIIDCYGKIGFLFIAKEYILYELEHMDSKHEIHYHLYNFIYDTKAFLDSLSVLFNDYYKLGKSGGQIDLKDGKFRDTLIMKEQRFSDTLKALESWISEVVKWRDALIHKYSSPLGFSFYTGKPMTRHEIKELAKKRPPYQMTREPRPYLSTSWERGTKSGNPMQSIEEFCDIWIKNACNLFDATCTIISSRLEHERNTDESTLVSS